MSAETVNSASSSASDSFIGLAQVDQPLFRAGISCPVDRLFPGDLGHQSSEEDPPQGRQGARWAGTRALISLSLETSCARALSQTLPSAGFAHYCHGSSWFQEVRGRTEPPPGARPLPATLPSRGVGTRRAQGSGPHLYPPLPVNYAGDWHGCSSCSSFPGNFHPGIPPPAQRAAPPVRPGPQAPSPGSLAAQPWVPGYCRSLEDADPDHALAPWTGASEEAKVRPSDITW